MSAGYLRPLWMDPEADLLTPPQMPVGGPGAVPGVLGEGPPEAPAYVPPDLLPVPALSFRDRLGLSMADMPQFTAPLPQESGGQAFARGLAGGLGAGYSTGTQANVQRREADRVATNATRKSEADRNYAAATETWKAKLTQHYRTEANREGKVRLTRRMAEDAGMPWASDKWVDALEIGQSIEKRRTATASVITDPEVARVLGRQVGERVSSDEMLRAGTLLKPKPAPKPKETSPTESRRTLVAGIVADLARAGKIDRADAEAYLRQPGVVDTLASHGITRADLLREFPE